MKHHSLEAKLADALRHALKGLRRPPMSTYRLQLSRSFTFDDAAGLVPYLNELGVTHCYTSPFLKARAGSVHGYDITDHNALNPEIGSRQEFREFVGRLKDHGMGHIMDFVPNHMSIFDNAWWTDVLENGPSSPYARFFDIDWQPVKEELRNKVLLPILEDMYGNALESAELSLALRQGALVVCYRDHELPVDPKTFPIVLRACLPALAGLLGDGHHDYVEMQSIITACHNLPQRHDLNPAKVAERYREKGVIKRRLAQLCARNRRARSCIGHEIRRRNGIPGEATSFAGLHELLEQQAYRLCHWRVALDEVNYRRFFDINDLAAVRVEDPQVFEETHRLVRELLRDGMADGIRIDHIDGLFDPACYLRRLQTSYLLDVAGRMSGSLPTTPDLGPEAIRDAVLALCGREGPGLAEACRPLFLVVEKVLVGKETLRESWPADGTTGYEFGAALNNVFVNSRHSRALLDTYRWFTRSTDTFPDVLYRCKSLVAKTSLSAEISVLSNQLDKLTEKTWQYRDFTLDSLRDAIREVIACFPVYRTYLDDDNTAIDMQDRVVINTAVAEARLRNPAVPSAIFDYLRSTLLLEYPEGASEEARKEQRLFAMRFQQFTGPVMAKGMEDCAFYVYNPLASLNEVGGWPQRIGATVNEFHHQNVYRQQRMPHSLLSTSTHDSKRSEDVRARINVLSEVPGDWRAALVRWSRLNRSKKVNVDGLAAPDRNEEYLVYQTLLGTYPEDGLDEQCLTDYVTRVKGYVTKALREAKVHTSWVNPNDAYEQGAAQFVSDILEPALSNRFLADFRDFTRGIAACGRYNSLSQTVLKLLSPGVPDIYQGNEVWTFSLVDPDNRRPVDFGCCQDMLRALKQTAANHEGLAALARRLMEASDSGEVKLYVTWKLLNYRRDNAALFEKGSYLPLEGIGPRRSHICAFAWKRGSQQLIVVVPRLIAGLTRKAEMAPLGEEAWGSSLLALPRRLRGKTYSNVFTGEQVEAISQGGQLALPLKRVFSVFPLAVLELALE